MFDLFFLFGKRGERKIAFINRFRTGEMIV